MGECRVNTNAGIFSLQPCLVPNLPHITKQYPPLMTFRVIFFAQLEKSEILSKLSGQTLVNIFLTAPRELQE